MDDEERRVSPSPQAAAEGELRGATQRHLGPDRTSPYPVSRLSGPVSLVDSAREIERADRWIASTSGAKLEQIAAQMKALRAQAEQVLREARENAELHRAEARFQRHPGKTYHLYQRTTGQRYWSMLSPSDWGTKVPHTYLGSYRLEADQSWTPLERLAARDQERAPLTRWLHDGLSGDLADPTPPDSISEKEPACDSSSSLPSDPTGPASSGS